MDKENVIRLRHLEHLIHQKDGLQNIGREIKMARPLLTTKLYIPPVPSELVSRSRLIERLNVGLHRKLTLISAPAGFGKTTLLSEWVAGCERSVAWVSLDEGDNDPTRFWTYFIAALQTAQADTAGTVVGETALAMLTLSPPPHIEAILTALINDIASSPISFVFVFDDYHRIEAQPVHNALIFLLDHLPPQIHLVIATRSDPPWPLARARARNEMTELRLADLRFTLDEVTDFFTRVMSTELVASDIAKLTFRTEGWIAGLRMAALALQAAVSIQGREDIAGFIRAFTGSNRYILDYLVEEVLQHRPKNIQTFLLQTSILNRMSSSLCDAVRFGYAKTPSSSAEAAVVGETRDWEIGTGADIQSPIPDFQSRTILEYLDLSNLFIVPLDDRREWYRYHHLFADLVRPRLQQVQPDLVQALHRRASAWFEGEGLIPEAVHHAIAAEDFDRAAAMVESLASPLLNEGRSTTLLGLMTKLPNESIVARPLLCVLGAWAYFLTWQFDKIEPLLHTAELALSEGAQPSEALDFARLRGRAITLRAFMAQAQGDLATTARLSREALKYLDDDDLQLCSVLETNLGDISLIHGDIVSARQHLDRSIAAGQAAGNLHAVLGAVSRLAELEKIQGRLHQAAKTYRQAIQLGTEWGPGQPLPGIGRAHVGLAQVLYEWNDLEGAAQHLTQGLGLSEQFEEQEIVVESYLTLARLKQAQGQADGATEALERAAAIVPRDSRILDVGYVSTWQARISLAQNDVSAAKRWADSQESELSLHDGSDLRFESPCLTLVRVRIAQVSGRALDSRDQLGEATRLLERLLRAAEIGGRVGSEIEMRILCATALQAQGDVPQAMTSLERALSLAEPEGYVRVFVDEGPAMDSLLRQAASRGIAPEYVSTLLSAFGTAEPGRDARLQPSIAQPLIDPLSERELEVLRLLTTSLSPADIAEELCVAVSTVRSHIKNIYAKLNVHRRLDAVKRARELKLV